MKREITPIQIKRDLNVDSNLANSSEPLLDGELCVATKSVDESIPSRVGVVHRLYVGDGETTIKDSNTLGVKYSDVSAKALTIGEGDIGDSNTPVYVNDGVVTPCDITIKQNVPPEKIRLQNTTYTAGTGISIDAVNDVEDESNPNPIYAVSCTGVHTIDSTTSGSISYTDGVNEDTVVVRIKDVVTSNTPNVGDNGTPVYVNNNVLKACTNVPKFTNKNVANANTIMFCDNGTLQAGVQFLSGTKAPSGGKDGDFYFMY